MFLNPSLFTEPLNFKFSPELKYSYKYEAEVNTVFDVEKHNASTLSINGHFDFYFPTPCHGELEVSSRIGMVLLKLTDLSVTGTLSFHSTVPVSPCTKVP